MNKLGHLLWLSLLFLPYCTCTQPRESIKIDGSSTVYVLTEAIAEEYQKLHKSRISIGVSGTGGGFKKLCSGRINLIGASRSILKSEQNICDHNQIKPTELAVALDGIVVVVNKSNNFITYMNVSMLKKLFEPSSEGKINYWSDLDNNWPKHKFQIFAPGISSGTYDYFTKAIVGKLHASRGDITSSEDDNVLVHGVKTNKNSIGFFSYAYFLENQHDLKALPIKNDLSAGNPIAIMPSKNSIQDGSYKPLSRPIFIYANIEKLSQTNKNFLHFYLANTQKMALDVGFVPLSPEAYAETIAKLRDK